MPIYSLELGIREKPIWYLVLLFFNLYFWVFEITVGE